MSNFTTIGIVMNVALVLFTLIGAYFILDLYTKRIVTRGKRRQLLPNTPMTEGLLKRVQVRLILLDIKTSAYDFVIKVIIQSLIIGSTVFFITILSLPTILSILITFIVIFGCLIYPFYVLDNQVSERQAQREFGLPHFVKMLIALMKTHTPYQALEESIAYTPEVIRPFVEQLVLEIEQMPNSSIPFENFSQRIGIEKSRNLMTILHQSMNVSSEKSSDFLNNLKKQAERMENDAIDGLLKISLGVMKRYQFVLFFCIVIPPFAILSVIGLDIIKGVF